MFDKTIEKILLKHLPKIRQEQLDAGIELSRAVASDIKKLVELVETLTQRVTALEETSKVVVGTLEEIGDISELVTAENVTEVVEETIDRAVERALDNSDILTNENFCPGDFDIPTNGDLEIPDADEIVEQVIEQIREKLS